MQPWTRNFIKKYRYGEQDFIPCAKCGRQAVDLHHIQSRGQGGGNEAENLLPLCREDHNRAELREKPYLTKEECLKLKKLQDTERMRAIKQDFIG